MKRRVVLMTVATSIALLAAAARPAGGPTNRPRPSIPTRSTIPSRSRCIPFSADHEVAGVQAAFDAFTEEYLDHIDVTTGVEDDAKVLAAIRRHAARRDDVMGTGRSGGVL